MIKELSIRVYHNEERPFFQFYTGGVESLYLQNLGKVDFGGLKILNIYFTSQSDGIVKDYGFMMEVNAQFNFVEFQELDTNYLKKKMILDVLHKTLINLSILKNWDMNLFEKTYQKCLDSDLSYNWYFKSKLFRSPNRSFYFGLWHVQDIGTYEIWQVLFDQNKNEINRRICFHDDVCVFFIDYASWEGLNDRFFYRFNGPQKKFVAIVEDLINGDQIDTSKSTSDFFK